MQHLANLLKYFNKYQDLYNRTKIQPPLFQLINKLLANYSNTTVLFL